MQGAQLEKWDPTCHTAKKSFFKWYDFYLFFLNIKKNFHLFLLVGG